MRLLLLRHAKSDWAGQATDHDRPLSPRGRNAVPRIGAIMREKDYEPDLVLCSTAIRTRETIELLLPHLEGTVKVRYDRTLYLSEWPQLLAEIRAVSKAATLLLVGHNPGLEQLALALALQPRSPAERARAENLARKFPTAALAVLDFEVEDWGAVKPGSGRLIDYVRPKDLEGRGEE